MGEEFYLKYGNIKVRFQSYYKYIFTFQGKYEGKVLKCLVGGNPDDIYRLEVKSNKEYVIRELEPNCVEIDGEIVYEDW